MLYAMRFSLPDKPGSLGDVATAISHIPASIVMIRVIEHEGDYAVDEIVLETKGSHPDRIREVAQGVAGVAVECVRRIQREPDPLAPLLLAQRLMRGDTAPLETLVEGIPGALPAAWAIAFEFYDGPRILAASSGAPIPGVLDPPWLPLVGARRLHEGPWMPPNWRMVRYELAAVPLGSDSTCLVCGRWAGMRFRVSELTQLEILTGIALDKVRPEDVSLVGPP